MKKVAVLMSTYNGGPYLKEQIESILLQKGDYELKIYVRDDGSTDSTCELLEQYQKQEKLIWYQGENVGPANSFMDLLYYCGEYDFYVFADQDDVWDDDKIETAINKIKNIDTPALFYSNARLVDKDLNPINGYVYNNGCPKTDLYTLVCAGGLLGCTMVLNNMLVNGIRTKEKSKQVIMHDYYVAVVCIGLGGQIVYDNNSYMSYRQHGNNVVGVSYGVIGKIKNRIRRIKRKMKVSIADQAADILERYKDDFSVEYVNWLKKVMTYRKNFFTRVSLACSCKTHYISCNMSITTRLAILLGNR